MAELVLETRRLLLRTLDEDDAVRHYRVLNTPAVMEHLGGPLELHEIEAKHAKSISWFSQHGFGFMMLVEKASGEIVGHAGMKRVDNPQAPNQGDHEIGWIIREDRWRRGYAEEAMRAVIDWAFTRHRVPQLVALTSERNEASWRLMEKLGMKRRDDLAFTATDFPPDDQATIQYSLTPEKWEQHT